MDAFAKEFGLPKTQRQPKKVKPEPVAARVAPKKEHASVKTNPATTSGSGTEKKSKPKVPIPPLAVTTRRAAAQHGATNSTAESSVPPIQPQPETSEHRLNDSDTCEEEMETLDLTNIEVGFVYGNEEEEIEYE